MGKLALLIGVSEYQPGLNPLPCAVKDVEAMRRVLTHPEIGNFAEVDITVLQNPKGQEMQYAIENLFADRQKEDLLLFYFSGHGIKDEYGKLYLSTSTTRKQNNRLFKASTVAATFLHENMNESRSQRQVIILDCCFSGAIAQGLTVKDDGSVKLQEQLGGKGRAILTSSTSTQYSFEQEGSDLSIYTRYLVEGMEKGAADRDGDGWISIDELHEYASSKVKEAAPAMTPKFYPIEEGHKILLAKSPKDDPKVKYRKEVETRAKQGQEFSVFARRILDAKRHEWGLTPQQATAIEEEVLQPYREYERKRDEYEQALIQAIAQKYPFSQTTQKDFKEYQQYLGLRDEDIASIEQRIITPKQAEYEQNLQQVERLQPEEETADYENRLYRYEQEFIKALKAGYPPDEYVRNGLISFQQSLGLQDEDVARIEEVIISQKQPQEQQTQEEDFLNKYLHQFDLKANSIRIANSYSQRSNSSDLHKTRGDDLRLDLKLKFQEAIFGGEKEIKCSHLETCDTCGGSGERNKKPKRVSFLQSCYGCGGRGRVQVTKKLRITIPPGVDNGVRLRISGEGDAGVAGGSPGDLYIYLFVDEDSKFVRDGINILSTVTITPEQALSGYRLNVDTVDGSLELVIPRNTTDGTVLKLKNRGVPKIGKPVQRGDHLITINVQ